MYVTVCVCLLTCVWVCVGCSLDNVWLHLDLATIKRNPSLLYVGISRARQLEGLRLDPFRISGCMKNGQAFQLRVVEELRLVQVAIATLRAAEVAHSVCVEDVQTAMTHLREEEGVLAAICASKQ